MIIHILVILLGFVCLITGANVLVKGASRIAKKFHLPEILIGLTIVAIGTSLPELIISISSAAKGYPELILGNAIGSNLCNLLLILGVVCMIKPLKVDPEVTKIHLPVSFFTTVLVLLLANGLLGTGNLVINRLDGVILLVLFFLYFSYPIYVTMKDLLKNKQTKKENKKDSVSVFGSLCYITLGIILLKLGGDFVVNHSVAIANYFQISERIIGLTIIAIGTSLPELVTAVVAILRNDFGLALGNLIGSCMFNVCVVLGIGAMITPLTFAVEFNITLLLLMGTLLVIWLFHFLKPKEYLTRLQGAILFFTFCIYLLYLLFQ